MTCVQDGLLARLGSLLGVSADETEAVLRHDEQRARSTLRMQRRGFLGAAAAMAAAPFVPRAFVEVPAFGIEIGPGQVFYYIHTIRERVHQPFWDSPFWDPTIDASIHALYDTPVGQ
jgi:hypothetical protein